MDVRMEATKYLLDRAATGDISEDTPIHDLLAGFGAKMFEVGRCGCAVCGKKMDLPKMVKIWCSPECSAKDHEGTWSPL